MSDLAPASGQLGRVAIVVKGYPRLSETFIAQELLGLERAGVPLEIWSLRRPTDTAIHPLHRAIQAPLRYLPEYLYQEPWRVMRAAARAVGLPGFGALMRVFWRDLWRDPTPSRGRRLGQAFVLARELDPAIRHLHVHYLHTPASVVRYACLLSERSFSFSAHAKDIWTTPAWEKREKIAASQWGVTCTKAGLAVLADLSPAELSPAELSSADLSSAKQQRVSLVYHGLDLTRFPPPPERPARDGSQGDDPLVIVSVGRLVAKKGYGDLLAALAQLPAGLAWRVVHIGSGELKDQLRREAEKLGIADKISWLGGQPQDRVIAELRAADLFVLACTQGDKGDRDGLPNVILEAATQALPIISTRFAGVPEFIRSGDNGLLVEPGDHAGLASAIALLLRDPARRHALGRAACQDVGEAFSFQSGIDFIAARLGAPAAAGPPQALAPTPAVASATTGEGAPCASLSTRP
jgi:glycosyltransferase involved in cell wall biosynthesis